MACQHSIPLHPDPTYNLNPEFNSADRPVAASPAAAAIVVVCPWVLRVVTRSHGLCSAETANESDGFGETLWTDGDIDGNATHAKEEVRGGGGGGGDVAQHLAIQISAGRYAQRRFGE
jgi:hypothetical protein